VNGRFDLPTSLFAERPISNYANPATFVTLPSTRRNANKFMTIIGSRSELARSWIIVSPMPLHPARRCFMPVLEALARRRSLIGYHGAVQNVHIVSMASELQIIWDAPDNAGGLPYLYDVQIAG
jgi:hypothetical protein